MHSGNSQTRRKIFWMVGVALALRLGAMAYLYPLQLAHDHQSAHWAFGYETGQIAASIAEGHGFSSPLFGPTGPTAWITPVYPYILAGVFLAFGIFSKASALVILTFNAVTSALTCVPIFLFARKTFAAQSGERAGEWAGWLWAIFPYSIYWPVERIWDTWLATLLLAILFWMALGLAESPRLRDWIAFGALSGVAALTDPAVLAPLPFLVLWALWRFWKRAQPDKSAFPNSIAGTDSIAQTHKLRLRLTASRRELAKLFSCAMGCLLAVILVVSPWFIRNAVVFHKFIPFRDNFNLALRVGNVGDTRHMLTLQAGPWLNSAEWRLFQQYGELAYMRYAGGAAADYIAAHPREYVDTSLRRFVYIWTGFWPLPPRMLEGFEPDPALIFLLTALTVLALIGLRDAFKTDAPGAAAYAIVMIFFPFVYYFTSLEPWYRAPMDPILIALAAGAIASRLSPVVRLRRNSSGRENEKHAEQFERALSA